MSEPSEASAGKPSPYARGWFAVAWSTEIAIGQTRPLKYFGQHLAAWRGEDGQVRVVEAHCAHMGAHLAVKGKVHGNCIQCPFHGWRYDGDGKCVEIPYARTIPAKARQQAWRVREANGAVFVWFDPADPTHQSAPEFEVPVIAEYGTDDWLPWSTKDYHVKTHPREIVDNLADKAHFSFVHDTDIDEFRFEAEGHTATQYAKGRAKLAGGGVDVFSSTTRYHGPAILLMGFDGALQNKMMVLHTPVDEGSLDLRLAVTLKVVGNRDKTAGFVGRYLQNLQSGFEDDLAIWEHKIYKDPAVLCDGDGPIFRLRKWYKQFYAPRAAAPAGGAQ